MLTGSPQAPHIVQQQEYGMVEERSNFLVIYWTPALLRFLQNRACLSVRHVGLFLRNGSFVFSDFWHDGR